MRAVVALLAIMAVACSSNPPPATAPAAADPFAAIETRLAEADALASRGCYLCLAEAAKAYANLVEVSDNPIVFRKSLENDLMLALREIELRLPDSGALERARQMQPYVPASYAASFAVIEAVRTPLMFGVPTRDAYDRARADRKELVAQLELDAAASPMRLYFYVVQAMNAGMAAELKPRLETLLNTHPHDLAVKYRLHALFPASNEGLNEILATEPRFGEVHFLLGQRAIAARQPVTAHRELTQAHAMLPESVAITLAFARLEMTFSRFAQSLALLNHILAAVLDDDARMTRAIVLSYMERHYEAIHALDDLIRDLQNNPGEKLYWRAWNRFQLGQAEPPYEDATTALKVMANPELFKLAGMTAYNTMRVPEARARFESALRMNAAECDSMRYLGQIDFAEGRWTDAAGRYSRAAACYEQAAVRMSLELAELETDTSGLRSAQIARLRASIKETAALQASSAGNASLAARNAGSTAR